jgi:hypothetical protein
LTCKTGLRILNMDKMAATTEAGDVSVMSQTMLDEGQIKELFKQAIVELVQERKDLLYDLLAEVVEDALLLRAIQEGEDSPNARREDVLRVLEGVS